MDFFSFSFIAAAPIGVLGMLILNKGNIEILYFSIQLIGYLLFFIFSYLFFIRKEIKVSNDGRYCSIFFIFFSLLYLIINFVHLKSRSFFTFDFYILSIILVLAIVMLFKSLLKIAHPKIK